MERSPSQALRVFGDDAVDRALADWLDANELELVGPELLETGRSGGKLVSAFVRELNDRRTGGMRVIKLVASSPDAEAEPRNHRAALSSRVRDNEKFIDRHLVELAEKAWKLGDYWVMFQRPAGDGKDETRTLAALGRIRRLPDLAAQIVRGVLSGWNPEDPVIDQRLTAARFVKELLGARLDGEAPLQTWVRDRVDAKAGDRLWFALAEGAPVLPDPLALSDGSPLSDHPVRFAARGRGHGDLHPGNIMVPVRADASSEDFWLIDLSRFSERALLARDPVHLLLCLVADDYLPHLSEEARAELLTALSVPDPAPEPRCDGPLVPQGLADLVNRVRAELIEWGAHRGVTPAWRAQWFLALHACALMFTARDRYPDRDRWWFYLLAAHACRAYLDSVGVEHPRSADIVVPPVSSRVSEAEGAAPALAVPDTAVARRGETAAAAPVGASASETAALPAVPSLVDGAATSLEVLAEIWNTFERPAQHVSDAAFSQLKADVLTFVQRRATQLSLDLGKAQLRSLTPLPARADGSASLDRVLDLLHDVAAAAKELRKVRLFPGPTMQALALGLMPKEQNDLLQALMDLLAEVRRAILALST